MSIRERRNSGFRNVDLQTLSYYIGLVAIGWIMIVAATNEGGNSFSMSGIAIKQAAFIGVSFIVIIGISFVEWKFWRTISYVAYAFSLLLLIGVLFFGNTIKGATSWYNLGGFSLQPSEIAKFGTCLAMASYLSSYNANLRALKTQVIAFGLFLAPMGLILLQPDAGSAMVFASFLILFYREGLSENFFIVFLTIGGLFIVSLIFNPYYVILGFIMLGIGIFIYNLKKQRRNWTLGFLGLLIITLAIQFYLPRFYREIFIANFILLPILTFILWREGKKSLVKLLFPLLMFGVLFSYGSNYAFNNILKPHQQSRINVWLNPSKVDSKDAGYNLRQSKLAIGAGGLYGKGFLN